MPKLNCYFAHSRQTYGSPEESEILEELQWRRLVVYEPFKEELKILEKHDIMDYSLTPYYKPGREIWTKCLGAIKKCDVMLAWIPRRDSIGVSAEIAEAYNAKKFIMVITSLKHPSFTVYADQMYENIADWKHNQQYRWLER